MIYRYDLFHYQGNDMFPLRLRQVLEHSDCLWHLHRPERSERSELAGEVLMRLAASQRAEGGAEGAPKKGGFQ